ncbi:MAG TPA: hypothetical protein VEA78_04365 [Acidimicrobiales bacterium]|nr:hypothetical protein [Acidimicrobiales bacterium]
MATNRCSRCGEEKDETEFNRKGPTRLQAECRQCNSEHLERHYRENREYDKAKAKRIRREILA